MYLAEGHRYHPPTSVTKTVQARSAKAQRKEFTAQLRASGLDWPEVAEVFRAEYQVNSRVALRMAHGWSQEEVAKQWNQRWPDDPKTFKNFSYWEQWPSKTGHQPSLDVLGKLAELYHCHVADLISDGANFREQDHNQRQQQHQEHEQRAEARPDIPAAAAEVKHTAESAANSAASTAESDAHQQMRELMSWAPADDAAVRQHVEYQQAQQAEASIPTASTVEARTEAAHSGMEAEA